MLQILFFVLFCMVFGKIFVFALKAAWGLSKIIVSLIFLPLILIGLVLKGLLTVSLIALAILGVAAVFGLRDEQIK